jgi:hypothetical protein
LPGWWRNDAGVVVNAVAGGVADPWVFSAVFVGEVGGQGTDRPTGGASDASRPLTREDRAAKIGRRIGVIHWLEANATGEGA